MLHTRAWSTSYITRSAGPRPLPLLLGARSHRLAVLDRTTSESDQGATSHAPNTTARNTIIDVSALVGAWEGPLGGSTPGSDGGFRAQSIAVR